MTEENLQEQFAGRVFKDEKTGATIVLSKAAKDSLLSQIPAEKLAGMSKEEIKQELAKLMQGSEWINNLQKIVNPQNPESAIVTKAHPTNTIIFDSKGRVLFFTTGWNEVNWSKFGKLRGFTQVLIAESGRVFSPPSTTVEESYYPLPVWSEKLHTLVFHDGYQIRKYYDLENNRWNTILPHERKNGEYELLTPQQRMIKAMADLKRITGYDGSGVWTEGEPTVVDYTDSQGTKHHQELKVHLIHESQDPNSPVVYEVLEDPNTGEMMFTIRQAKDNPQNIQGLNEQQAELVRQAWAYLLSADPAIMQKFWRVNRTMGVGKGIFPQLSTNDISYGLILFNENRIDDWGDVLPILVDTIVGESYELYAAQYGWGFPPEGKEGYPYTNLPPDCFNTDAIADAAQRAVRWYESYGKNLPPTIRDLAEGVAKSWADGIKHWGNSCQPQIPFEP
ncbi:MAG: hypothetical protein Kow00123_11410 [Anaerolineales bacterium]